MSAEKPLKMKNLYLNAALAGDIEAVRSFLAQGVVVDVHSRAKSTALMRAAGEGYEQIVRLLLAHGANANAVNTLQETALTRAAAHGQLQILEVLLMAGAEVDGYPNRRYATVSSPLGEALLHGHQDAAVYLINHGANPDLVMADIVGRNRID